LGTSSFVYAAKFGDWGMFFSSVARTAARKDFLAGVALLALSAPASAQAIDTHPQWDGASSLTFWGVTNTKTYGQTITSTPGQTRLSGFTFELNQLAGGPTDYQAFVYRWDPATQRITGSALFSSGVMTVSGTGGFTPVSINTGNVALTPGQQYVLFLTTTTVPQGGGKSFGWGRVANTAYAGGNVVYQNDAGGGFSALSTTNWNSVAIDFAFAALLSNGNTGESHAQAQQGAFQLGNQFLTLLTDPFATNKVSTTGPLGYAAQKKLPSAVAAANAMVTKAPPIVYTPYWDTWGAAFGGTNNLRGDAVVGSTDVYTRVGGVAAGADYRFGPDSLIGFSLGGGNINWSLTGANGAGGGTSDTFMAGVYGRYSAGAGYISGAATYTNYWMDTGRPSAPGVADRYEANFQAQGWAGRLEGGYKIGQYWNVNWTPYAAIQGQGFRTPDYAEVAVIGAPALALNVAGRTATAFRGELGLRTDKVMAVGGGQLNLFGKLAYAHDEISNPSAFVNFVGFGAGAAPFTVFGAVPSRDLALTTAGAEWRLLNGLSFMVKFDGEFGDRSETYSGTGRIRYTW
jgi:uncharacterized protein with beta-barrel porin domain